MANTSSVSVPQKGMITDLSIENNANEVYSFAMNAMVEDKNGEGFNLQNEMSLRQAVDFPPNNVVVGFLEIPEQRRVLYALLNTVTKTSQIGEVMDCVFKDNTDRISKAACTNCPEYVSVENKPLELQIDKPYCQYRLIVEGCFNFDENYPVDMEYKLTDCSVKVYFTDNLNERKYIYFDYTDLNDVNSPLVLQDRFKNLLDVVCDVNKYGDQLDCNSIRFHPAFDKVCIKFNGFVNGGDLEEGVYQILIAYSDVNKNPITEYFAATNTMPLFDETLKFNTNNKTNKALSFHIENLERTGMFQYYNIVIAKTINQFTEFILLGTFPTTQQDYTYTGFEKSPIKLAATEVFYKRPFYELAESVTTANNFLMFAGLKEYPLLNLQPVANKIKLSWTTVALREDAYRNPKNTFYYHTHQRDEIYPYGIIFEFDNGRETCTFHIPGRTAKSSDLEIIDNEDLITELGCEDLNTCIDGFTVTVRYSNTQGNCAGGHKCNAAQFNLLINGQNEGLINLNNGGGVLDPISNDLGGDRETTIIISKEESLSLSQLSSDGTLTFALDCATPSGEDRGYGNGNCHTGVHWIQVRDSTGALLYDDCPSNNFLTLQLCNSTKRRWQVYNTGSVTGSPHDFSEICDVDKCWEYGEFAYWESTETYPQDKAIWGDLCGKPIRHHKYPDSCVTHIHDQSNLDRDFKDSNYIYPIGVTINHESVKLALDQAVTSGLISQKDRNSIVGYRIVRGNRVGNKSIDAKGLLFNMFRYNKDNKDYYFPNYAYNDLGADPLLSGVTLTDRRYTFHSPDTHFVNARLGNILKIETEEYGKTDSYFTHSECQAKQKFLSRFARTLAFGLGVAAAISATGEKHCEVITYKGDYNTDVTDFPTANITGNKITGGASGTVVYAVLGATGTVNYSKNGGGDIKTNAPDRSNYKEVEKHNTAKYTKFNPTTGKDEIVKVDASERQITTCKGQAFQVFNSGSSGLLGDIFGGIVSVTNEVIQRAFLGLQEMQKIVDVMELLIPYKNYSIQQNSIGNYNNYICVPEGNKLRAIDKTAYLQPIIQKVEETEFGNVNETININNWQRESSVYIKTSKALANPTRPDDSKVSMDELQLSSSDLNKRFNKNISSYYVSVKRDVPNQYGQICNINYIETGACSFDLRKTYNICETKVFGGDTFINRFAIKRKMPFFQHTMCKMPDGSDILYRDISNGADPTYYFNTDEPLLQRVANESGFNITSLLGIAIGLNDANFDAQGGGGAFQRYGFAHMYNYGIPSFLVESDINVSFRHATNNKENDFYPHNTDLKEWLEERNVPIEYDNTFFYNRTYSKQNNESVLCSSCNAVERDFLCTDNARNRIIYSESSENENKFDNWLIFKANNFFDFPLNQGRLISADGIENSKVLVRLEKGTKMFPAYNTIQATEENIQVGTGGMFKAYPQDVAITKLGYGGSQHRAITHTEFGHSWVNAEQGNIFNLGSGEAGLQELAGNGNENWFKENLPFQIKKDFREISSRDIDNNLKGIGLHLGFDKRYARLLVTKLDYQVINNSVIYDKELKEFYITKNNVKTIVSLKDKRYFCDKSWTMSYHFKKKMWVSHHSYKPNFYIEHDTFIQSGIKSSDVQKLYSHNLSNKSYQVVYGKLEPFIIEVNNISPGMDNIVNSIQYTLDVIRYHNNYDEYYNPHKTFNKGLIYGRGVASGWLNFVVDNSTDFSKTNDYPKLTDDGYSVLTSNSEGFWNFNDFFDVTDNQYNNMPLFLNDCNNVNKTLNKNAVNYSKIDVSRPMIRQKAVRVRLVNDIESNYKFIFNFAKINSTNSIR